MYASANMGHPSREDGFVFPQGDWLAENLAIFTAYRPQVVTFFPVALAHKEHRNSYGKFYMHNGN
jgi:hypothetical protein